SSDPASFLRESCWPSPPGRQRRSRCRASRRSPVRLTSSPPAGLPHSIGPLGGPSSYHGLWPWLVISSRLASARYRVSSPAEEAPILLVAQLLPHRRNCPMGARSRSPLQSPCPGSAIVETERSRHDRITPPASAVLQRFSPRSRARAARRKSGTR